MRWAFLAIALLGSLALSAPPAAAVPVDLELVIAVDISRSVDDVEAKLQRDGYIAAFTNPRVIEAIRGGSIGAIAVCYVEWASYQYHQTVIDWVRIDSAAGAADFAARIDALPRVSMS